MINFFLGSVNLIKTLLNEMVMDNFQALKLLSSLAFVGLNIEVADNVCVNKIIEH